MPTCCSGPPGSGGPHSPTLPLTQTRAPRSCPLHPPEGLQQDAELLSAAQRKHGDQHLQWARPAWVGALATLLTQVELVRTRWLGSCSLWPPAGQQL